MLTGTQWRTCFGFRDAAQTFHIFTVQFWLHLLPDFVAVTSFWLNVSGCQQMLPSTERASVFFVVFTDQLHDWVYVWTLPNTNVLLTHSDIQPDFQLVKYVDHFLCLFLCWPMRRLSWKKWLKDSKYEDQMSAGRNLASLILMSEFWDIRDMTAVLWMRLGHTVHQPAR